MSEELKITLLGHKQNGVIKEYSLSDDTNSVIITTDGAIEEIPIEQAAPNILRILWRFTEQNAARFACQGVKNYITFFLDDDQ